MVVLSEPVSPSSPSRSLPRSRESGSRRSCRPSPPPLVRTSRSGQLSLVSAAKKPHKHEPEGPRSMEFEDFAAHAAPILRRVARVAMRRRAPERLDVDENDLAQITLLKLLRNWEQVAKNVRSREHMLSLAAQALRHVIVDHVRAQGREKRSPHGEQVPIESDLLIYEGRPLDVLALDEALSKLELMDPDMARAIELRFFGGHSSTEVSRILDMPLRTFERRWNVTSKWLRAELE